MSHSSPTATFSNSRGRRRFAITLALLAPAAAFAGTTERVSVGPAALQGNGAVDTYSVISGDGRYIVFSSAASMLVPGDTNGFYDIFVRDVKTGVTTRVSVSSSGEQGNDNSYEPWISPDGRFVGYNSYATNLAVNDMNGSIDVYLFDRTTGATRLVSETAAGVAGNGDSYDVSLSADGRYAGFQSDASNLVPGDTNGTWDAFLRDLVTGTIQRVSTGIGGSEGNAGSYLCCPSADGHYAVFTSEASNIVPNDFNNSYDVFRRDLATGAVQLVSVAQSGSTGDADSYAGAWSVVSADGRFIAFDSGASDLVAGDTNGQFDAFIRDMTLGITTRVSVSAAGGQGDLQSYAPSVSFDGRYVTYVSEASTLVPNDVNGVRDSFRFDRMTGAVLRISVSSANGAGDGNSYAAMPSSDGRHVVFTSEASNLVLGDTNGVSDVFVFSDCWVEFKSYGKGLSGSGGFVPVLSGANGSCAAAGHSLHISNLVGGATGILFAGIAATDVPLLGGHLLVSLSGPWVAIPLTVSGPVGIPGFGKLDFLGADLNGGVGVNLFLQFMASDANAQKGVSMTNGLELDISP